MLMRSALRGGATARCAARRLSSAVTQSKYENYSATSQT